MSKIAKSKKSKQIVSVLLCFALLLSYLQTAVFAGEAVKYRYCDENGANWDNNGSVTEYTLVTADDTTWGSSGTEKWYVSNGDITINSRVTVNGTVNLILSDNSKLTVNGGISVNEGNSLTIYAQSTGNNMGELIAEAVNRYAGIGGDNGKNCGTVVINGGVVTAKSENRGAGIGGGLSGDGGVITINDGIITASTGASASGAGIGGGGGATLEGGSAGEITIRGGTIYAEGAGRGIGAGADSNEGSILITGGVIYANGVGNSDAASGSTAAAPSSSVSTTISGNAIIVSTIDLNTNRDGWTGLVIYNGNGTVYGDVTLPEDLTINEGNSLIIPDGSSLTIPEGTTVINDGSITKGNGAELIVDGTLDGRGKVYGPLTGTVSITGSAVYGQKLKAVYVPGLDSETYSFQWYRGDDIISGATTDEYILDENDIGEIIKIVVAGTGTYNGEKVASTSVVQKATFADGVISVSSYQCEYDGEAHGITLIVSDPDDDVTVKYGTSEGSYTTEINPEYTNVGNYTVFYQVTKKGYESTGRATITITKADISNTDISLDKTEFSYNGTSQKPIVTVKSGDKTIASTNYDIIWPDDTVNPDTNYKEVVIKGKGNYKGEVKAYYKINKTVHQYTDFKFSAAGGTYDGTPKAANVTLKSGLEGSGDITVKYYKDDIELASAPIKAGTYTVKIDVTDGRYFSAIEDLTDTSWTFRIVERNITVKANSLTKNFGEPNPEFTYEITSGTLIGGEKLNGKLACENNGNAGTYTITQGNLTNANNPNYNITFISGTLTIGKVDPDLGDVKAEFVDNSLDTDDIVLNRSNTSVEGELTVDPDQTLVLGVNQISWTFTPETNNYNTITGIVSVTVRDTVGPTGTVSLGTNSWNELLNNITFGFFYKETQTVTVSNVYDNFHEVEKIEYYESKTYMNLDTLKALPDSMWKVMPGTGVNVTPEDAKQFVYYIRMTDTANNKSYISTNGAEFDTTAPQITGITDGATYYTTQKAEIIEKNLESAKLNGSNVDTPVIINGNRNTTYTITATDKVDQSSSVTIYMKPISSLSTDIDSINDSNVTADDKDTIIGVNSAVENVDISNATDSELVALDDIKNKANQLLTKIDKVEQKISDIEDVVDDYELDYVNSDAKEILEQTKKDINDLTDSDNLTSQQKDNLEILDSTIQNLLDRIEEVTSENARITDKFDSYNINSVKSSDEDDINELIDDINKQLLSTNLTEDETKTLELQKSGCEALLERISSVRDRMASIKESVESYDPDNLTMADKEIISQLIEDIDELVSSDNTTQTEKATMSSLKDDAKELIKIIDEAELSRIKNELDKYTPETVKTTDESDIQLLLEAIKSLLDTVDSQLDPDELNELKEKCENLLVRIKEVNDKLDDISERIGNYSEDTVKSSDKDSLTELVNEIAEFSTSTNLLETEKDTLSSQKTSAEDLLKKIDELLNKLDELSKKADLYDLTTVKATDKEDISLIAEDVDAQLNTSNYTDEEISKLNGLKTFFDNLLARINGVSDLITNLSEQIAKYSADTVKATDKAALEQIITSADELLDSDNLIEDQRNTLEGIKQTAEGLLEVIKRVADSLTTENTEKVKDITADNVKPEDREDLEKAKTDLEDALKDNADNYTDEQKKEIQDNLDRINGALDALDKVEAVEKLIEALPDVIELEDAEQVDAAKDAYDALTDHEKSLISDELKAKLDNAVSKLEGLRLALEANANNDSNGNANSNNRHNTNGNGDSPDTGDKSTPVVWTILFIISGLYLGVMIYGVKRKKKN